MPLHSDILFKDVRLKPLLPKIIDFIRFSKEQYALLRVSKAAQKAILAPPLAWSQVIHDLPENMAWRTLDPFKKMYLQRLMLQPKLFLKTYHALNLSPILLSSEKDIKTLNSNHKVMLIENFIHHLNKTIRGFHKEHDLVFHTHLVALHAAFSLGVMPNLYFFSLIHAQEILRGTPYESIKLYTEKSLLEKLYIKDIIFYPSHNFNLHYKVVIVANEEQYVYPEILSYTNTLANHDLKCTCLICTPVCCLALPCILPLSLYNKIAVKSDDCGLKDNGDCTTFRLCGEENNYHIIQSISFEKAKPYPLKDLFFNNPVTHTRSTLIWGDQTSTVLATHGKFLKHTPAIRPRITAPAPRREVMADSIMPKSPSFMPLRKIKQLPSIQKNTRIETAEEKDDAAFQTPRFHFE